MRVTCFYVTISCSFYRLLALVRSGAFLQIDSFLQFIKLKTSQSRAQGQTLITAVLHEVVASNAALPAQFGATALCTSRTSALHHSGLSG